MRKMLIFTAFAALTVPAMASAQPYEQPLDPRDEELVASLPHPFEVQEMGDRLGQAVGALVDVPVGGLLNAIDPAARAHPDTSLADVAGRGDPHFRSRMQDEVAGLSLKMADLARGMAAAAPALRRSFDDLRRNFEGATRGLDHERGGWDD